MPIAPRDRPTEKQLQFARKIANALGLQLGDAVHDKSACSTFISAHLDAFKARASSVSAGTSAAPTARATQHSATSRPTEKQVEFAEELHAELKDSSVAWPGLARAFSTAMQGRQACSEFIEIAKEKRAELQYLQGLNQMAVASAAMRAELQAAPSNADRLALLKHFKSQPRKAETLVPPSTPLLALISYWSEAITQTAFVGLATADNLLGSDKSRSFTLRELPDELAESSEPELSFQDSPAPVRHLLVRLTRPDSGVQGGFKHDVVCVMPLQAYKDDSKRGYRWGRALKELPRFNRELLGEEARVEGLGLTNTSGLDAKLESMAEAVQEPNSEQAPPTMDEAWQLLDECFSCLTSEAGDGLDLQDWIAHLADAASEFRALRRVKVTFSLVDGGAAMGPTRHVANTLAQLQAEPDLLETPELALLRRVASIKRSPAREFEREAEASRVEHLTRYCGHMDSRTKDGREAYPLDPAQRDAILAMQSLTHGELLAVNGPPGTGKTSLLRAVIASTWVAPLLDNSDRSPAPPMILASAATNQAVTNIISSFDETPGPVLFDADGAPLVGKGATVQSRWVPWLVSYGWFAPANRVDPGFERYQQIRRGSPLYPWQFDGVCNRLGELTPENAERAYLDCAASHLGGRHALDTVLEILRKRVDRKWASVCMIQSATNDWLAALTAFASAPSWGQTQEARVLELVMRSSALKSGIGGITHLSASIDRLTGQCDQLKRGLQFVASPRSAIANLRVLDAPSKHPKSLDYSLAAEVDDSLAKLQLDIQARLAGGLIARLRERIRDILRPADASAEHEALVNAVTQAGVRLTNGTDLPAIHTAIGAHRVEMAPRLEELALVVLEHHLLGDLQGSASEAPATTREQLIERLFARLPLLESKCAQLIADRQAKALELEEVDAEINRLTLKRSNFISLRAAAERARTTLADALQVSEAEAGLTAKTLALADGTLQGAPGGVDLTMHAAALLKLVQDRLDTHERLDLFHLAARYWEGRYVSALLEHKKLAQSDPAFRLSSAEQLRHLAMLAPVFVATSASTPKLMRRFMGSGDSSQSPYLFGEADLLIVDEAGQATPEGTITSSAFAKRAIVVGDVDQLSPVWSIDHASDSLLAKRFGLERFAPAGDAGPMARLNACGLLVSSGSIMLAAQNATAVSTPSTDQRGLTLTNHYRCLAPIIDICNRMVYRGTLTCVTRPPKSLWQPHLSRLAYLLVPDCGETKQPSGSRANDGEAKLFARWLRENRLSILEHFAPEGDKKLHDLVGIVTPYKAQARRLRAAIAAEFKEQMGELASGEETRLHVLMTIDTVHKLQGAERQIVLCSMVDTDAPDQAQFFDKRHDLINVAVSRAKHMLITGLSKAAVRYGLGLTEKALAQGKPSDYLMHAMAHHGSRLNMQKVVVVESPNKCDKIHEALGGTLEVEVLATGGHVRQLKPPEEWDASTAVAPQWGPLAPAGQRLMSRLETLWPGLQELFVATDPDAEGETIAWHVLDVLANSLGDSFSGAVAHRPRVRRMRFNTLLAPDIRAAVQDAGDGLDAGLVKSALARALLDHLVAGHLPVSLGLATQPGLKAGVGRVQLGIADLVQRHASAPERYEVHVSLPWGDGASYAPVVSAQAPDAAPISFASESEAQIFASALQASRESFAPVWQMSTRSQFDQSDSMPVVNTARFLALAHRVHGFAPARSMLALQQLYEGRSGGAPGIEEDDRG